MNDDFKDKLEKFMEKQIERAEKFELKEEISQLTHDSELESSFFLSKNIYHSIKYFEDCDVLLEWQEWGLNYNDNHFQIINLSFYDDGISCHFVSSNKDFINETNQRYL